MNEETELRLLFFIIIYLKPKITIFASSDERKAQWKLFLRRWDAQKYTPNDDGDDDDDLRHRDEK